MLRKIALRPHKKDTIAGVWATGCTTCVLENFLQFWLWASAPTLGQSESQKPPALPASATRSFVRVEEARASRRTAIPRAPSTPAPIRPPRRFRRPWRVDCNERRPENQWIHDSLRIRRRSLRGQWVRGIERRRYRARRTADLGEQAEPASDAGHREGFVSPDQLHSYDPGWRDSNAISWGSSSGRHMVWHRYLGSDRYGWNLARRRGESDVQPHWPRFR